MQLTGLHFLLTYQCTFACDHCFVWGSPNQSGVMTWRFFREALKQAHETQTIRTIFFEGGEPFLYYPLLLRGVELAHTMGFETGIVSNACWATNVEDARLWLQPFAGMLDGLSVSSDLFHYDETMSRQALACGEAANELGIDFDVISIAQPEKPAPAGSGVILPGDSGVMYRGRAAVKLAAGAPQFPWFQFDHCPHEDLVDPGRVHLDFLGNLHLCQGLVLGNLNQTPLVELCEAYDPARHPIVSLLLDGGPRRLVEEFDLAHPPTCADACHLCYLARLQLRGRYPETLAPDQVYGAGL